MNRLVKLEQPHGLGHLNLCWQRGSGGYLASAGGDNSVAIFNRSGKLVEKLLLPGRCISFGWDGDGDLLAIVANNSNALIIWDSNNNRKHQLDCGLRDPLSCVLWAKSGHTLAVATTKGNVCIYNHTTSRRIPILGKHTKSITCGSWNVDNLLALGSEDRTISISNIEGDTIKIIPLRADPSNIMFSEMKVDEKFSSENTVSVIVGKRTLFLFNLQDPENPIELAFQTRYGNIVTYQWFGDGYMLIGFSDGYIISISTHIQEIGQELFQSKIHKECLNDIAFSAFAGKVASCGDNSVKVLEIGNLSETVSVMTVDEDGEIEKLSWSEDGQLLAAATSYGSIHIYLSKLPMLGSACVNYICMLTSLSQITVHYCSFDKQKNISEKVTFETEIDPSFLCMGPFHLAFGMNNRIWYYELINEKPINRNISLKKALELKTPKFLIDREYMGTVISVRLNSDYSSVLFDGRIHLHIIDMSNSSSNNNETKVFPEGKEKLIITSHSLTPEFLIYTSNSGHIRYFSLEEWKSVIDYKHFTGIKSIYPNQDGIRCVFIDSKSDGYLYNPINDSCLIIPKFPSSAIDVFWELFHAERHVFVVSDLHLIYIYVYIRESINGPSVVLVGQMKMPVNHMPLMLYQGELYSETATGKLARSLLSTHQVSASVMKKDHKLSLEENLDKLLSLLRYSEAWDLCTIINTRNCWIKLANVALTNLNIDKGKLLVKPPFRLDLIIPPPCKRYPLCNPDPHLNDLRVLFIHLSFNEEIRVLKLNCSMAIDVYRNLEDPSMVESLEELRYIEDKKLLAGKVCVIMADFNKAQNLFLESNEPLEALYLRQDLLEWDMALQLAKNLAPQETPRISKEYAHQLELIGRYSEALQYYEYGLSNTNEMSEEHISACYGGIARSSIRNGDYQKGMEILTGSMSSSKFLKNECAEIFENLKKFGEAAQLYEQAENYNQAALCYIRLKNWTKISIILPYVSSIKVYAQYAKAMEAVGNYQKAISAYEMARDFTSMIRLTLNHLNDPQDAVRIVQESHSIEGAKMVARYFQKIGDILSAIKFLTMSACYEEAFDLSKNDHKHLELYGNLLIDQSTDDEAIPQFLQLAEFFETSNSSFLAGKYYFYAKYYQKAIKFAILSAKDNPENDEALSLAIDIVAGANDDVLANQVIELLLGELDGQARNPKYVFRLYMARKEYRMAAKTAIIIANEEQINGSYRAARDILYSMCCELKLNQLKISAEMLNNLMLLHSYILARVHVKGEDHIKAAILLTRVADNISKFPSHIVPILTSTVIECHRANMKLTSFKFASTLMKAEYRNKIDSKYRKKIEAVVRKAPKSELIDELKIESTSCPYCDTPLPCTQLTCFSCHSSIPFCIVTGWHITRNNLTACPSCNFPALYTEFLELLESLESCPLCSERVLKSNLILITNYQPYLYQEGNE